MKITNTLSILSWQSKGLSNENIDPPTTSLSPSINYVGNKIRVKFTGSCLKQSNKLTYTHKKVVNIYIVYELGASSSNFRGPTIKNFISKWWIRSKCFNFWSRYEFFCTH